MPCPPVRSIDLLSPVAEPRKRSPQQQGELEPSLHLVTMAADIFDQDDDDECDDIDSDNDDDDDCSIYEEPLQGGGGDEEIHELKACIKKCTEMMNDREVFSPPTRQKSIE
ncbi:MAG: hypothetical protein SGARI_005957, partial [Bacillariaceae sp.]